MLGIYNRNLVMQEIEREHVKYRVSAFIVRLRLSKKLNFQTKITWKRNVNKVETDIVTHEQCESVFNQSLELELNLVYNAQEARFQPKFTEFAVTVIYQGKVKSGGSAKFDAAEVVNKNYADETVFLNLVQCPDPEAYVEVVFNYEVLGQSSRSLFNELSMLNPIGFQQDLSQIDFKEDQDREKQMGGLEREVGSRNSIASRRQDRKQDDCLNQQHTDVERHNQSSPFKEKEYDKIHNILDKFQNLSRRFKASHKQYLSDDQNTTKNQSIEVSFIPNIPNQQQQKLKSRISQLERQLQEREQLIGEYERKTSQNERYISELQLKVHLLQDKYSPPSEFQSSKSIGLLAESEGKYRQLYEKTQKQLEELRCNLISDVNFSKENVKFKKLMEEVNEVDEVPQFQACYSEKLQELQRENIELQTKIASISHNIAQIFNAAYDYGGAKLLDYLQNSIGLIEQQS